MNITNLEMAQASIEIFGGFACIMMVVLLMMNRHTRESLKFIKWMFGYTAVLFFAEAGAYIFRGNIDDFSMIMNRVCNFVVFLMNYALVALFIRYVCSLVKENDGTISKWYTRIADICAALAFLILVINIFTDSMYYFDEMNYYHRNTMWYVYTLISMFVIFMGTVIAIRHRKEISQATQIIIIVYSMMPVTMIIVQLFYYGFSLSTMAIAVSLLVMLVIYLAEWKKDELENNNELPKSSRMLGVIILFTIMVISMSASIISCIISIKRMSDGNSQRDSHIIAHMINDRIENEFLKPITVSVTMSEDLVLKKLIKQSAKESAESVEKDMAECLDSFRTGFGYQMVFVGCEESKAYFTYNGISKFIDIENDPHDVWYKEYVSSGKKYILNVDTDEVNDWALSIFVNVGIFDKDNSLLGCGGVGVEMDNLKQLLADFEEEYNVKINLIKASGEIQLDSDGSRIEHDYLDNSYLDKVAGNEFYYEKLGTVSRLTKYMEDLGWYLVIEDKSPDKINVLEIVTPSIIIFLLGLVMLAIAFGVVTIREQKTEKELAERKRASLTDELTGLFNRRAYEEDSITIQNSHDKSKLVVVMMDVNGLKGVNDNIGHNAGDELIIGAANCMRTTFATYGRVYRVGGDEFAALLKCSKSELEDANATFKHNTDKWRGELVKELTISVGYVFAKEHTDLSVEQLKELADKFMYIDKEEYYKCTGKERRK